ncbi:MAG TPA: hypothetical protein VM537_09335 [Anaerolineae bacterium]|nr:hypothetical protein [Anaerolineae bacterium]
MKLTELWTPEQCREAMELLGEVCWDEGKWYYRLAVTSGSITRYARRLRLDRSGESYTVEQGVYVRGIIQVAAEQVVRDTPWEPGRCCCPPTSTCVWYVGKTEHDTYLAALLAALRAVCKETRDGE